MIRRLATAAALVALGSASGARAQDIAASLCKSALGQDGRIDPLSLRSAAIKGVEHDTLDYNHDGDVSRSEIFAALTTDAVVFCTVAKDGKPGRATACGKGADETLFNADNALASFWKAQGTLYDVSASRKPSAAEIASEPGLSERDWAPLLDEQRRFGVMTCRRPETMAEEDENSGSGLLVGADIDSLSVKRLPPGTKDRLKKVDPAELSFASDNVANTRTFAIDGVAGYKLFDTSAVKLTPFVQYIRTEVRDRTAGTDKLTGKLAFGALGTFVLGYDQIDLAPLYAKDIKTRAELLGGRLTWRPGFLYRARPFRNAWHFACERTEPGGPCKFGSGLALWTDFQLISSFGTVLADGNDPDFLKHKEYLRVGPSAALHIYGLSGLVQDFSLDASAKRLFTLAGGEDPVYSLKVDVSYWVGGSEHLSITTGYERSRDEETLEPTDKWKLGLGVRF